MTQRKTGPCTSGAVALAGALALLGSAPAGTAAAADIVECYGISPAGENDCASRVGHHCGGYSTVDYSGLEWEWVESKQRCLELHGKLEPFEGINPYYADMTTDEPYVADEADAL